MSGAQGKHSLSAADRASLLAVLSPHLNPRATANTHLPLRLSAAELTAQLCLVDRSGAYCSDRAVLFAPSADATAAHCRWQLLEQRECAPLAEEQLIEYVLAKIEKLLLDATLALERTAMHKQQSAAR